MGKTEVKTVSGIPYVVYEGETVPDYVLELIRQNGNCHPFLGLLYLEAKKPSRIDNSAVKLTQKILELGICYGRATMSLLYGCKDGGNGHLWSIDAGHVETEKSVQRIKARGLDVWFTWMRQNFFDIPDESFVQNPMDLIWVDFDKCDYNTLMDKLVLSMREGSMLIYHNIDAGRGEKEAIMKYASRTEEFDYAELHYGHGAGILTKKKKPS